MTISACARLGCCNNMLAAVTALKSMWKSGFPLAAAWVAAAPKRHVLGSADLMVLCFEPEKMENLGNRHRTDWLLAGVDALKPACQGLTPRLEPFRYTPGP